MFIRTERSGVAVLRVHRNANKRWLSGRRKRYHTVARPEAEPPIAMKMGVIVVRSEVNFIWTA